MNAKTLSEEGYTIVFLGEPDHIEVKGVVDYVGKNIFVVKDLEEVKNLNLLKDQKIAFLSQTTQIPEKFYEIKKYFEENFQNLKIVDTICLATKERQDEAVNVAKQVDVMIVVGGYKSSNTKKLFEICKKITLTYHIESVEDLKNEWFECKEKAGLIAGASTPYWIIDEVVEKIKDL